MVIGRCRYYSKGQGGESGTNGNLRGGGRRAEGKDGGGGEAYDVIRKIANQ